MDNEELRTIGFSDEEIEVFNNVDTKTMNNMITAKKAANDCYKNMLMRLNNTKQYSIHCASKEEATYIKNMIEEITSDNEVEIVRNDVYNYSVLISVVVKEVAANGVD